MIFNSADIKQYTDNAPEHYLGHSVVVGGVDDSDVQAMRKFLMRETAKNIGFAWLLADSSTESWGECERCVIHSGKVGRPKTIVKGNKVGRHIHLFTIATDKDTDLGIVLEDIKKFISKRRNKKPTIKQSKSKPVDSMNYVQYMTRQADHLYSDNRFDWGYFDEWIYDDKI